MANGNKREFLFKERKRRKLTQQQVADSISINRVTYSQIERGERDPSLTVAIKIADFFNISVRMMQK